MTIFVREETNQLPYKRSDRKIIIKIFCNKTFFNKKEIKSTHSYKTFHWLLCSHLQSSKHFRNFLANAQNSSGDNRSQSWRTAFFSDSKFFKHSTAPCVQNGPHARVNLFPVWWVRLQFWRRDEFRKMSSVPILSSLHLVTRRSFRMFDVPLDPRK